MEVQGVGLVIFIFVICTDVFALLFDLFLYFSGRTTYTQYVWADGVLGIPIIVFQVVGLIGLTIHFYWRESDGIIC